MTVTVSLLAVVKREGQQEAPAIRSDRGRHFILPDASYGEVVEALRQAGFASHEGPRPKKLP